MRYQIRTPGTAASSQGPTTKSWPVVIAEGKDPIGQVSIAGGKMFVGRLRDVKSETTIYTLEGKKIGEISYPTIGTGSVVRGRADSTNGFYTFSSFTVPSTIFHYDIATGKTDVWAASKAPFDSSSMKCGRCFIRRKMARGFRCLSPDARVWRWMGRLRC